MSVRSRHGREAVSEVTVLARMAGAAEDSGATLVGVRPLTGRTHQIRVHLASIGHPCLGDPLYGGRRAHDGAAEFTRQALHAMALFVSHTRTGEWMRFVAPLPKDFAEFIAAHGLDSGSETVERWIAASARPLAERPVDSDRVLR
jgi:23S rRNA pseudouridine1911/1915/1917 synthase